MNNVKNDNTEWIIPGLLFIFCGIAVLADFFLSFKEVDASSFHYQTSYSPYWGVVTSSGTVTGSGMSVELWSGATDVVRPYSTMIGWLSSDGHGYYANDTGTWNTTDAGEFDSISMFFGFSAPGVAYCNSVTGSGYVRKFNWAEETFSDCLVAGSPVWWTQTPLDKIKLDWQPSFGNLSNPPYIKSSPFLDSSIGCALNGSGTVDCSTGYLPGITHTGGVMDLMTEALGDKGCVLLNDGSVSCWGWYGTPSSSFVEFSSEGLYFGDTCGVTESGNAVCWNAWGSETVYYTGVLLPTPSTPETCTDSIQNQDETDVDFGGVCGIAPSSVTNPDGSVTTCYASQAFSGFLRTAYTGSLDYNADGDTLFNSVSGSTFQENLSGSIVATWNDNDGTAIGTFSMPDTSSWYELWPDYWILDYVTLKFAGYVPVVEAKILWVVDGEVQESDTWTRLPNEVVSASGGVYTIRYSVGSDLYTGNPSVNSERATFWTFRVKITKLWVVQYYGIEKGLSDRQTNIVKECRTISKGDIDTYSGSIMDGVGLAISIGLQSQSGGLWFGTGWTNETGFNQDDPYLDDACAKLSEIDSPAWLDFKIATPSFMEGIIPNLSFDPFSPIRCMYKSFVVLQQRLLMP